MHCLLVLLALVTVSFAQPMPPPDSVWTFAFDDGGDEYFYDAIQVDDGYLLCGEWREWNALAGHALMVKIDLDGELVWTRTYPHDSHRRFRRIVLDSHLKLFGEYVDEDSRSYGLFLEETSLDGQPLNITPVGFEDGRQQQAFDILTPTDLNEFRFTARNSDESSTIVFEYHEFGGGVVQHEFPLDLLVECKGEAYNFGEGYLYGRTLSRDANSNGFVYGEVPLPDEFHEFGGSEVDFFNSGIGVSNPTMLFVGGSYSYSNGSSDLWLQGVYSWSYDSAWSRHYGGLAYEDGVEIVSASDTGFIIAGNFSSEDVNLEQSDYWLLKVDENGDSVWSVVAGGEEADRCEGMIETENGYLLFGSSQSFAVPGWDGCAMYIGYVPDLAVAPASLSFGPVAVGDSATRTLHLINSGSRTLGINGIENTDNYHVIFDWPAAIEVGETLTVEAVFTPFSVGTHVDTLRVVSTAISGEKIVRCIGAGTAADADQHSLLPTEFKLYPAYPNPFNATAQIEFDLAANTYVELAIFDIQGRVVEKLVSEDLSAGTHARAWTCGTCAGGVYFARLSTADFVGIQKLVLLK